MLESFSPDNSSPSLSDAVSPTNNNITLPPPPLKAEEAHTPVMEGFCPILPKFDIAKYEAVTLQRAKQNVLKGAVKQEALNMALVRLITRRKLPHDAVEWPELRRLLLAVNNTVGPKLEESRSVVPRIIAGAIVEVSKLKKARCQVKAARPLLPMFESAEQEKMALRRAKDKVLKRAVRQDELSSALAILITKRNLPDDAADWEELQKLLIVVNRTVQHKLVKSRSAVPKQFKAPPRGGQIIKF